MSFGIFVKNDFGDFSIDDKWVNYSLLAESSISCAAGSWDPSGGGTPTYPQTVISITPIPSVEPPILFARHAEFLAGGSGHFIAECKPVGVPGAWTGFSIRCGGSGSRTLNYRIYAILPASGTYGVIVKRSDGEICFDSGRKPLIVERVIAPSEWSLTYNGAAGPGFREQDWTLNRPVEDYISISTPLYFDGISGLSSGRVLIQIAAGFDNPTTQIRHSMLFDSGTSSVNPGAGSRSAILPMLCDAS